MTAEKVHETVKLRVFVDFLSENLVGQNNKPILFSFNFCVKTNFYAPMESSTLNDRTCYNY